MEDGEIAGKFISEYFKLDVILGEQKRLAVDDIVEAQALVKKVRGGHISGLQPQGDAVEAV